MTDEEHRQQALQHAAGVARIQAAERMAVRSVAQAAARAELEQDLVALRRHNVKSFAQTPAGFDVEFFPAEPQAEKPVKQPDLDLCACGHHKDIAHTNGLCVEGCTEEQCRPKEKA